MSITLSQMFQQGDVFHLIGMAILFVLAGVMINAIGSRKDGMPEAASAQAGKGNTGSVTAAISAAVNQYRKINKK